MANQFDVVIAEAVTMANRCRLPSQGGGERLRCRTAGQVGGGAITRN